MLKWNINRTLQMYILLFMNYVVFLADAKDGFYVGFCIRY